MSFSSLVRFSLFKVLSWQQNKKKKTGKRGPLKKMEGDRKNKHRINKRRLGKFLSFENKAVTKVVTLPCRAQKCDFEFLLI